MDQFYHKVILKAKKEDIEYLIGLLFDLESMGLEEKEDSLIAYFNHDIPIHRIIHPLEKLCSSKGISFTINKLPHKNWNKEWIKGIKPLPVGKKLIILAPWHKYKGDRLRIIIEPDMAFGTGHHPTTYICLEETERIPGNRRGSFLDIGTGTGILSVAARKLGFDPVVATESDPVAIKIAGKNFTRNKTEYIKLVQTEVLSFRKRFSFIVANLNKETIKILLNDIIRLMDKGGTVVLAGILKGDEKELLHLLYSMGIEKTDPIIDKDGWIGIKFHSSL